MYCMVNIAREKSTLVLGLHPQSLVVIYRHKSQAIPISYMCTAAGVADECNCSCIYIEIIHHVYSQTMHPQYIMQVQVNTCSYIYCIKLLHATMSYPLIVTCYSQSTNSA